MSLSSKFSFKFGDLQLFQFDVFFRKKQDFVLLFLLHKFINRYFLGENLFKWFMTLCIDMRSDSLVSYVKVFIRSLRCFDFISLIQKYSCQGKLLFMFALVLLFKYIFFLIRTKTRRFLTSFTYAYVFIFIRYLIFIDLSI